MELKSAVAVVTGGVSGLGEATVRRFAAAGARVGILDLPGQRGDALARALGEKALFAGADVTDPVALEAALDAVVGRFGGLSVAVSCAGVIAAGRVIDRQGAPLALGDFERAVRVNLVGTFNFVRLAASRMAKNTPNEEGERGVVVTTASIAAYDGQVGQAAYAASKAGVAGMVLPLARDLAPWAIRCVAIAPGTFATPMMAGVKDELKAKLAAGIPFPSRLGQPSEFAALAEHIVRNPYLNGEVIRLDGALRMAAK